MSIFHQHCRQRHRLVELKTCATLSRRGDSFIHFDFDCESRNSPVEMSQRLRNSSLMLLKLHAKPAFPRCCKLFRLTSPQLVFRRLPNWGESVKVQISRPFCLYCCRYSSFAFGSLFPLQHRRAQAELLNWTRVVQLPRCTRLSSFPAPLLHKLLILIKCKFHSSSVVIGQTDEPP